MKDTWEAWSHRVSTLTRFLTQSHVRLLPKLFKLKEPTTITSNNQKRYDDEIDCWPSLATLKCLGTCTYSQEPPSGLRNFGIPPFNDNSFVNRSAMDISWRNVDMNRQAFLTCAKCSTAVQIEIQQRLPPTSVPTTDYPTADRPFLVGTLQMSPHHNTV